MNARFIAAGFVLAVACAAGTSDSPPAVLVELFTSEGCSSCPPADALLAALERPGVIILSEHVDYWNQIGWRDPFSAPLYSDRQRTYANRFGLESVYTPQMVVDGSAEFVGSDRSRAKSAIEQQSKSPRATVHVSAIAGATGMPSRVRVEVESFPAKKGCGVYLALASNEASSKVTGGENGGRQLHHVAVVRSITSLGELHPGTAFSKEVTVAVPAGSRLVGFVQERSQGRVLGAAVTQASP